MGKKKDYAKDHQTTSSSATSTSAVTPATTTRASMQYIQNYDDSSEDEDCSSIDDDEEIFIEDETEKTSLLTSDLGMKILRSPLVLEHYRRLKTHLLSNDHNSLPTRKDLESALKGIMLDKPKNPGLLIDYCLENARKLFRSLSDERLFREFEKKAIELKIKLQYETLKSAFENIRVIDSVTKIKNTPIRKTLPDTFDFNWGSDYSVERYLASLLLVNRSIKREIKNFRHNPRVCRNTRYWYFPSNPTYKVAEAQSITAKSQSRKEALLGIDAYKQIFESIADIIKTNALSDQNLASYVRKIINGEKITLDDKSTNLIIRVARLILGTEVMRDPAALIECQMALDLIISGSYKWSDMIDILPTVHVDAVKDLRGFYSEHFKTLSYSYDYDSQNISPSFQAMLLKKHNLATHWLMIKILGAGISLDSLKELCSNQEITELFSDIEQMTVELRQLEEILNFIEEESADIADLADEESDEGSDDDGSQEGSNNDDETATAKERFDAFISTLNEMVVIFDSHSKWGHKLYNLLDVSCYSDDPNEICLLLTDQNANEDVIVFEEITCFCKGRMEEIDNAISATWDEIVDYIPDIQALDPEIVELLQDCIGGINRTIFLEHVKESVKEWYGASLWKSFCDSLSDEEESDDSSSDVAYVIKVIYDNPFLNYPNLLILDEDLFSRIMKLNSQEVAKVASSYKEGGLEQLRSTLIALEANKEFVAQKTNKEVLEYLQILTNAEANNESVESVGGGLYQTAFETLSSWFQSLRNALGYEEESEESYSLQQTFLAGLYEIVADSMQAPMGYPRRGRPDFDPDDFGVGGSNGGEDSAGVPLVGLADNNSTNTTTIQIYHVQ